MTTAASLCAAIVAAPLLGATGHAGAATLLRALFAPLCHQDPARSFAITGARLAVCARCAGLHAGFLAGCLAMLAARLARPGLARRRRIAPGRAVLFLAALPALVEWLVEACSPARASGAARALTGVPLGFAAVFFVLPALEEMPHELRRELRRLAAIGGIAHAGTR